MFLGIYATLLKFQYFMNNSIILWIHKILEFFAKYWKNSQFLQWFTIWWNNSQHIGNDHKVLEFFSKYWNSRGVSPKTSNHTVMHLNLLSLVFGSVLPEFWITNTIQWISAKGYVWDCRYFLLIILNDWKFSWNCCVSDIGPEWEIPDWEFRI